MQTIYLADNPETTWTTPQVTRDTLTRILGATILSDGYRYEALHIDADGIARFVEIDGQTRDVTTLSPNASGLYDLGQLGWTFLTQDAS